MDEDAARRAAQEREAREEAEWGPWSTEGWTPRKKQRKITTDRSRAERIALGNVARKINLGQAMVEIGQLRERVEEVQREQRRRDWVLLDLWRALDELATLAILRRGRYRSVALDDAIDRLLTRFRFVQTELGDLEEDYEDDTDD